jgi:hypothetical protein
VLPCLAVRYPADENQAAVMTREKLYELVWAMPATEVAQKCGISNARLRKLCAEFNVPLPSAGYWTKVAYGKATARPPLPANTSNLFSRINSVLRKLGEVPLRVADTQVADFDLDFSREPAEDDKGALFARLEKLRTLLLNSRTDERGFVEVRASEIPFVRIRQESIERVVRLVGGLIRTAITHGFVVGESDHGMTVEVDEEQFCLRIYALRKQERAQVTRPEILVLEIYDPRDFRWSGRNLVEQWRDRGDEKIENVVDEFAAKLRIAAQTIKACRTAVSRSHRGEVVGVTATRLNELQREFLMRTSDKFAQFERLQALSTHLRGRQEIQPSDTLLVALDELIADLRLDLDREKLASEFSAIAQAPNSPMKRS